MSTYMSEIIAETMDSKTVASIKNQNDLLKKVIQENETSHQSCKKIVDKAAEMDANLSTAPSYTMPKLVLEARNLIQPLVELCKTSLSTRDTLSHSLDKMNVCFGLDDSFWGKLKDFQFITISYYYNGAPVVECFDYYILNTDKYLETVNNFKEAAVALSEYGKEHLHELNWAGQMLIDANFDLAA